MLWGGMLHHAPGGDAPPWTWRSVSRPYLLNYWSDFHEIWHAGPLGDLVVPFGDYIPVRKFPPKIRGKLYFFFHCFACISQNHCKILMNIEGGKFQNFGF